MVRRAATGPVPESRHPAPLPAVPGPGTSTDHLYALVVLPEPQALLRPDVYVNGAVAYALAPLDWDLYVQRGEATEINLLWTDWEVGGLYEGMLDGRNWQSVYKTRTGSIGYRKPDIVVIVDDEDGPVSYQIRDEGWEEHVREIVKAFHALDLIAVVDITTAISGSTGTREVTRVMLSPGYGPGTHPPRTAHDHKEER